MKILINLKKYLFFSFVFFNCCLYAGTNNNGLNAPPPPTEFNSKPGGSSNDADRENPIDMYEWYLLAFAVLLLVVYYVYYTKYRQSKRLV